MPLLGDKREHYNSQCKDAKAKCVQPQTLTLMLCITALNIQVPSNPQQPGPAYFKSARKCGIFGVSCEPRALQVNYLIDEDDDPGKGANATVCLMHHFIETHAVGKTCHGKRVLYDPKINFLLYKR